MAKKMKLDVRKAINLFVRVLMDAGHTRSEATWIAERVFLAS